MRNRHWRYEGGAKGCLRDFSRYKPEETLHALANATINSILMCRFLNYICSLGSETKTELYFGKVVYLRLTIRIRFVWKQWFKRFYKNGLTCKLYGVKNRFFGISMSYLINKLSSNVKECIYLKRNKLFSRICRRPWNRYGRLDTGI